MEQIRSALAAAQYAEMVAFGRQQVEEQIALVGSGRLDPVALGRGIADQIVLVCKVSPFHGSRRLGVARALNSDLTGVGALLAAGRISERIAETVVSQTSHLSSEQRGDEEAGPFRAGSSRSPGCPGPRRRPCPAGLMLAAMDRAIRARDSPTACHTPSSRRSVVVIGRWSPQKTSKVTARTASSPIWAQRAYSERRVARMQRVSRSPSPTVSTVSASSSARACSWVAGSDRNPGSDAGSCAAGSGSSSFRSSPSSPARISPPRARCGLLLASHVLSSALALARSRPRNGDATRSAASRLSNPQETVDPAQAPGRSRA